MKEERVNIIGVPISVVNLETCIQKIFSDFEQARGRYICVSNVHTTVMAHDDPQYFKVQSQSFMSVPDGKPLSIIGKRKHPEMERVTGPDLMRRIFDESRQKSMRHFFYGNKRENLQSLIEALRHKYPWLDICGYEPSIFREMSSQEEKELAERINQTAPDFVWVALGAPRQELFCCRMENKINGLMIGVGGSFDVLADIIPEAPRWMQDMSLEWLFRFLQEPKRLFKRYAITNTKFLWYLVTGKRRKNNNEEAI